MITVGITGGIGTGKSMICAVFKALEVPVFYADAAAKSLMAKGGALEPALAGLFGENLYAEGQLNRRWLADRVFKEPALLQQLNAIVHPATRQAWREWSAKQSAPYVLKEAAIFFESGTAGDVDRMVMVDAPLSLRILRTMRRDNITREQVMQRMDKQLDPAILRRLCEDILVNDDIQPLLPQILSLHERFSQG